MKNYKRALMLLIAVSICTISFPMQVCSDNIKSVIVENTPLAVTVENLSTIQTPFQWEAVNVEFASDQLGTQASFIVPIGKRLILEYVSIDAAINEGEIVIFSIWTTVNEVLAKHTIVPTFIGAAGGYGKSYLAGQSLRLYADGGSMVTIYAGRQLGGPGKMHARVSGYLVDF